MFPTHIDAWCPDDTFNVPVDVLPLHMGVGLRVLFPLRLHRALCLLQFYFSRASENFSFKGTIGDPLTTFDFLMSFCNSNLVCIAFYVFVFVFVFFLWSCLLSILGLESFCSFLRVQSSFACRVLVMMLPTVCGIFPGLGTSY